MKKGLGAIPSPLDIRDMRITAFASVKEIFPESFDIIDENLIIVKDQGGINSCVGHTGSSERDITEYLQHGKMENHSPGFIYANREGTLSGLLNLDGMVPRDAAANIVNYGAVLQEDFPYNDSYKNLKNRITPQLLEKAYPRRASSYYFVTAQNEVKTALQNGHAVWAMLPIYPSFYYQHLSGHIVRTPNVNNETLIGYHEVLITGWRKEGYRFLNSWGKDWGDKGFAVLPYNYPIKEMLVVTDEINRYEEEVKRLYKDGEQIAKWAMEAVTECNKLGLMSGDKTGNFRPKDNLTREEAAQLIYNLYRKINNQSSTK